MRLKLWFTLGIIPLLLSAKAVKVEELLTEAHKVQADLSISYLNIQRVSADVGMVEYQSMNGDYIVVPTYMGSVESQSDRLIYSLALRYGISRDLEVYGYVNYFSAVDRSLSVAGPASRRKAGFNALGFGGVYQVRHEDKYPALLVGGTVDAYEHDEIFDEMFAFKSASLFISSFYTVDPVVFFIKVSYGYNGEHENGIHSLNTGDSLSITPQIHFAVNPYTSLNGGIRYLYKGKDHYDGKIVSTTQSRLGWLVGVSYEINPDIVISADMEKTDIM